MGINGIANIVVIQAALCQKCEWNKVLMNNAQESLLIQGCSVQKVGTVYSKI